MKIDLLTGFLYDINIDFDIEKKVNKRICNN